GAARPAVPRAHAVQPKTVTAPGPALPPVYRPGSGVGRPGAPRAHGVQRKTATVSAPAPPPVYRPGSQSVVNQAKPGNGIWSPGGYRSQGAQMKAGSAVNVVRHGTAPPPVYRPEKTAVRLPAALNQPQGLQRKSSPVQRPQQATGWTPRQG